MVILLLDTDTDFSDAARGGAAVITTVFDTVAPPEPTPCESDPESWFPDPVTDDDEPDVAARKVAQRRRAAALCDTCYFRVTCAVNALESGSDWGIWAGVALWPSPARFRKARLRIAEVIATEVIDTGEVPYRVDLMLRRRPDLARLVADATTRLLSQHQKRRAPRRLGRCRDDQQRRSA